MRTLLTTLASVLLLLAGSCTSPLATLKGGPALPPVGPGETQLVFHLNSGAKAANYGYTVAADVKYLVVQLHSKYGQSSKFAAAAVSSGIAVVNISGLVAGPWEILVSAYDWDGVTGGTSPWAGSADNTQPTLLYTAMDQMSIQPGTSTPVNLLLYKPGDLGSVTLTEALMVNNVTLSPMAPLASIPTSVIAGSAPFQVVATAWNVLAVTAASDQNFSWYSDNPDVAYVDNAGNVFPKNPGTTKITARSRESEKYGTNKFAQFTLTVDPPLVGYWYYSNGASMGYRILKITNGGSGLKVRYLTDVESTSMSPSHYLSDLTGTGNNTWQFTTNQRFNFSTGMQEAWAGATYSLQWDGSNQLTLNEAPAKVFTRMGATKPVSGINWPAGNKKTQQMLRSKDLVSPTDATIGALYFTTNNPAVATTAMMNSGVDFIAQGSVTVTARSVEDPVLTSSQTYTVDLAAPMPTMVSAPVASVTDTTVTLTWSYTNPGSLPGVNLYRSDNGGTTFLWLTGTPLGGGSFTDTGLTPGKEYLYYLVAVGGVSGSTYVDSLPTKVLSVYTTSGGYPVVVSGPAYNPENYQRDNGNGLLIPALYTSTGPMGYYGVQGFADNTAAPSATVKWLRAGQDVWVVASLFLDGAGANTLIKKWDQNMPPGMGIVVTGVNKVWDITSLGGGQFKLWGAGSSTATINFVGGDFTL